MAFININRLQAGDKLEIVGSEWGADNELENYDAEALKAYLKSKDRILLTASYDGKVVGLLLATKIYKPYHKSNWIYVDELDVHPNYRRKGIAKDLMTKMFEIAKDEEVSEIWLGTELDNQVAQSLYNSLKPDQTEKFVGYTYNVSS